VPIIFFTGQTPTASFISGLSLSGLSLGLSFAYLPKSTDPRVLEMKVRHALGEA
jgi:hypothetical protein